MTTRYFLEYSAGGSPFIPVPDDLGACVVLNSWAVRRLETGGTIDTYYGGKASKFECRSFQPGRVCRAMLFTKKGVQYLVPIDGQDYPLLQRTWTGALAMWVCISERTGLSRLTEFPE